MDKRFTSRTEQSYNTTEAVRKTGDDNRNPGKRRKRRKKGRLGITKALQWQTLQRVEEEVHPKAQQQQPTKTHTKR